MQAFVGKSKTAVPAPSAYWRQRTRACTAAKTADAVIDEEREPIAFVQNYGNSSIEYKLYVFTPNSQFLSTKYAVTRRIYYAFREDGVTMTYDHLNLHIVEQEMKKDA